MKLDAINFRDGSTWTSLKNLIYPVGSIFMKATDTDNPGKVIGDIWAQIQGKFLLGSSSSYAIKSTGGAATHTLTINEMSKHNHSIYHYITAYDSAGGGENIKTTGISKDTKWTWKDIISSTGATSQQYATLSSRCYLAENSLVFLLEVL